MNRLVVIIIFLLILIKGISQDSGIIKDGYQIYRYPNGKISGEGYIKNGKPDGFWKSYYVTGIKSSEGKRTNFLLDSIWTFYDQAGDTTEKISYLFGKKSGWYYKYKKDPVKGIFVVSKELYAGDKREGVAYLYYTDGKVQQTILYNNGKKEGLSKEYDKEGNIVTLLEYSKDFLVSRERINRLDNKGLKQGVWKDFYPGGGIRSEKTFKDDLMHGYYKEYDSRGKLTVTMLYENGSIVKSNVVDEPDIEIVNKHDQNGKLIYSGPYRNQTPVGVHREYNSEGKISNSFIYNDNGLKLSEGVVDEAGRYNGKWKDYYPDGKVQGEGQYTDSRRTGVWKFYNESGKMEQTGNYNNGRPDGIWRWYYENGSLLREEEYFQGQRDGSFTEYSLTGEIIALGKYTDGEKDGLWKYSYGPYTAEGRYVIGQQDGEWKEYYKNGKLKYRGNYIQGNPDGKQNFYFENGKLKEEQYYRNGIKEKTWKKYTEDGTALIVITYKSDMEVNINGVSIRLDESNKKSIN